MFARFSRASWAPYALLIVAVLLAYANIYRNEFVLDDNLLIVQNTFLRSWRTLPALLTSSNLMGAGDATGYYRPLPSLLLFLVYQAFGPLPAAFHALNVLLHMANACLVLRLGCRIGLRRWVAFAGALLWAVHPLHTEAVTYMSGIADLLYTFFCLLGLVVLLPDLTARKIGLATLVFILALASKEAAVIFPALAMATFFLVSRDRLKLSGYFRFWPLWLPAILFAALFITVLRGNVVPDAFDLSDSNDVLYLKLYIHDPVNRILTALATLPFYFRLIVWPAGLHMERAFVTVVSFKSWRAGAGAVIALLALLQILWGRGRRGLMFSWGALWFAIALAPMTGIVIPSDEIVYEHWMYLPMVGIDLSLVAMAAKSLERRPPFARRCAVLLAAVIIMAFGVKTSLQNETWRTPETFYENIFRCGENSGRAHSNFGNYYLFRHEDDKAAVQYQLALAHPRPMARYMIPLQHLNLAVSYLGVENPPGDQTMQGQIKALILALRFSTHIPEAIDELNKALELDPDNYGANTLLAVIYSYQGDEQKAAYYRMRADVRMQK